MPGWISGFFLFLAGFITSLIIPRDSLHFNIVQTIIAVFLFMLVLFIFVLLWPTLKVWYQRFTNKNKSTKL